MKEKITLNNIDIWIINQTEAVCEIKITLDDYFGFGKNEEKTEFYKVVKEKVSRIVKDHHIAEYVIDIN